MWFWIFSSYSHGVLKAQKNSLMMFFCVMDCFHFFPILVAVFSFIYLGPIKREVMPRCIFADLIWSVRGAGFVLIVLIV